jgi:hypothetical protein
LRPSSRLLLGLPLSNWRHSFAGATRFGISRKKEGRICARLLLACPQGVLAISHPEICLLAEEAKGKREKGQEESARIEALWMEDPCIVGM